MSIQTREKDVLTEPTPVRGIGWIERASGIALMAIGGVAALATVPWVARYPMAVAVFASICLVGVGIVWQKSWASSGLLLLGLLLCASAIGYLLLGGTSLLSFSWFFAPGAYLVWVGVRVVSQGRRVQRPSVS
ncbi:MAG: hypothetical protein M3O29_05310 [Actinomycetota bacterium]|nr:hypothetical protein [Actinomycetota bacterium]